jgi:hypothetical protein
MILAEQVVQAGWQKNSADIGVPNPRERHMYTCNGHRLTPVA